MRSLLNFLLRFRTLILFLILEAVALVLIFSSHSYHQTVAYGAARTVSGFVAKRINAGANYFMLRRVNEELVAENIMLRRRLEQMGAGMQEHFLTVDDSLFGVSYSYLEAKVVNNSINKQKNFITLDRGSRHGVTRGMGVASSTGVVGVVVGVSPRYSVVMSLLNADFRLSASIARNDYFGSLAWDGISHRYATLSEIPHHVRITEGDTIVTSGYSAIFPAGLLVGTLTGEQERGGDFLSLNVMLSTDSKRLTNVFLIGSLNREERHNLEVEVTR
ncbi:MAG: rod shape-determining protein MreC [Bacteroidales bacterium]|nr:rod shape-determining protein MreC [Bacteroidales bacterium]MDT8374392.1 rod shape-determining protein MreC [Bacteroidales bacterium]